MHPGRRSTRAENIILLCHCGYTPRRNALQRGSGHISVPAHLNICFYGAPNFHTSPEDTEPLYQQGNALLMGQHLEVYETAPAFTQIVNYSLTHDASSATLQPNENYDLITLPAYTKAHISDVFEAISLHQLHYTKLHVLPHRINKSVMNQPNSRADIVQKRLGEGFNMI